QWPDHLELLALDVAGVAFSHPASFSHQEGETLNTFSDPELVNLCQAISDGQRAEIEQMNRIAARLR
ncbi:hypothetical protein ACOTDN_24930, partial [Achromobacter xylosoxidans]